MDQSAHTPTIRPQRKITGMSAILLPFTVGGEVDWQSFTGLLELTLATALIPAVNMDTGYANLIDELTRRKALAVAQSATGGSTFVAGAFVVDHDGNAFNAEAYLRQIDSTIEVGGTPIIFQSFGLTQQGDDDIVESYRQFGGYCSEFLAFELGTMSIHR